MPIAESRYSIFSQSQGSGFMRVNVSILSLVLMLFWSSTAFPQAFVEQLSPPVLQRGTVNRIEVLGNDMTEAVGLWSSLPADLFRARPVEPSGANRAVFDVELNAQVPLGLYGLRLATRSGLSNVHLFLIDELPVTRKSEISRNALASGSQVSDASQQPDAIAFRLMADHVKLPVCITSICRPATIDRYSITVEKGQRVAFEVIGNRLGKDYDPLVRVRSATGKVVAECDNSVGLFFDCRFAHTFAEAGSYTVEVRDSRFEGHPTWHYVLRMGDFPEARVSVPSAVRVGEPTTLSFPQVAGLQLPLPVWHDAPRRELRRGASHHTGDTFFQEVRHSPIGLATWIPLTISDLPTAIEVEPNDTLETATLVATKVPATLNGVLGKPGDVDWFAFELAKDQKLRIQGFARTIGSAADLELVLFNADGREARRVDDTELDEASFDFKADKAGLYRLQVRDLSRDGGPEFAYRIDVKEGGPQFQLLAEAADLTVPQGTYQPLSLKVTRTEFNGEIHLELRGAPAGVTLEPNVIPAGATEFVGRIMVAPTTPDGLFTLQVLGTAVPTVAEVAKLQTGSGTDVGKPEPQSLATLATAKTRPLVDRQLKNVDLIPYALREDQRHLPPSLTNQIALMIAPPPPFDVELPETLIRLTRYQTAEFPIVTTRVSDFASPITFAVTGGQIGVEREERNQLYARFAPATVDRQTTSGTFFNRILTNLAKHRVDLTATAEVNGHRVNLIRTFTLEVQSAFKPTIEPELLTTEPGGSVKFKLLANRVATFDGPVTFTFGPQSGFTFPETITIPKGAESVEVELKADPKLNPGRHNLRQQVAGFVGKYEESFNLPNIPIEIKKPVTP
ncbi:MAG: PPC domain-containing protein [Planctomycetaceae bacterium]